MTATRLWTSRSIAVAASVIVVCALAPGGAVAGTILDRAARSLAADPVYVDPQARKTITEAEERRLERKIAAANGGPIYVAVLPEAALNEAGGDSTEVVRGLALEVHRRGTYAVVVGGHFRAASNVLEKGQAQDDATEAYDAHHEEGIGPTLVDFVDRVADDRNGRGGSGTRIPWVPLLLVGGVAAVVLRVRSRRRRGAQADLAEVKEAAREDLVALASDVQELEDDVERLPAAKQDYLAALDQYARASDAFDRARTTQQLRPVAEALDQGRYLMESAKARLAGREPPERRPACFFDPRHGPSVRDVQWSPDSGAPRDVPACAACALRVEQGEEPESRQVLVGGRMTPYWAAGPMYGSYFGGFLPGLLVGEMLGGFGGFGWGAPTGYDGDTGDSNSDFGGGDFGGGDFGGGDFGGGDFGGGGGGDF